MTLDEIDARYRDAALDDHSEVRTEDEPAEAPAALAADGGFRRAAAAASAEDGR